MAKPYRLICAASNNRTLVSSGPTQVKGWACFSISTDPIWVNFYNANAAADVADGAVTPDFQLLIPENATAGNGSGLNVGAMDLTFEKGLVIITSKSPTANSVLTAANETVINLSLR